MPRNDAISCASKYICTTLGVRESVHRSTLRGVLGLNRALGTQHHDITTLRGWLLSTTAQAILHEWLPGEAAHPPDSQAQ